MTTWIATTQDDKLADRTSDIESTNATTAADLQLDGNEYQAKSGVWVSLTRMPYILCGGHTITTNNDGTFYINVQSPNGKKADYAAYTIGPFGTGFGQAGEYTAQRWDTSDVNQIRFRLWNTKDNRWCGRVAIFGSWIAIWNRQ